MKRLSKLTLLMIMLSLFFSYNLCAKEQKIKGQAKVNYRSANLYLNEKKVDKALGFYLKVLDGYPDHVLSLSNIAAIYYNKATEDRIDVVANLKLSNQYYEKMLTTINSIPDYSTYEMFDKLNENGQKVKRNIWLILFKEANNHLNTDGELDLAEKGFNELLALSPDSIDVYMALAVLYDKKNDKAKQAEIFNTIMQKDPSNSKVMAVLAFNEFDAKNFAKAAELYTKLTTIEPTKVDYYLNAASCYINLKDNVKALEFYEKAHNVDPSNVDAIANCASLYQANKDNVKATAYYIKLYELEKTEEDLSILCYHLSASKDWKNLIIYGQKWYELNPNKKEAVQLIIFAANNSNNKELAAKYSAIYKKM